jgi:hypothetical protein
VWSIHNQGYLIRLLDHVQENQPYEFSAAKPLTLGFAIAATTADVGVWNQGRRLFQAVTQQKRPTVGDACAVYLNGQPINAGETARLLYTPARPGAFIANGNVLRAYLETDFTRPYQVVAKFRDNKMAPLLYPTMIYNVAKMYNNAWTLVEINDNGQQIADILHHELEYEQILYVNRGKNGQVVSGGFGGGSSANGVRTDKRIKRVGCSQLKTLLETQRMLIFDRDIISEFSTFIENKGSYAADEGYHDDLVMPLVLFGWLTTNPYFKELTDVNLRETIFETQINRIEEELTPFGFIEDGRENIEPEQYVHDGDLWSVQKDGSKWLNS